MRNPSILFKSFAFFFLLALLFQACRTSSRAVSADTLHPGDLVFFRTDEKARHVGMYLSDEDFLHASTSKGVMVSNLHSEHWRERLIAIRRPDASLTLEQLHKASERYRHAGYAYGQTGPNRFDCSGFVWRVYRDHGIDLPRSTRGQMKVGTRIAY